MKAKPVKKKYFYSAVFTLSACLFTGCASINSSPKEERHQMELSVHKLRTDLEDIKHDLNTNEIQVHILEGKVLDQEETITELKTQLSQLQTAKLDELSMQLSSSLKKASLMEKKQDEIISDLKQLSQHANQTTTALSQYKEKIQDVEKQVALQVAKFEELAKLKKLIDSALDLKSTKEVSSTYTIKEGDSLEKIAKQHSTSVEELKRLNNLQDNLILAGNELVVPKAK